jgi:1,2-diacylglycerol 3-alpha-glucosyltransferase
MKIVHICLGGAYNDGWGYHDNLLSEYNKADGHDVTIITTRFIDNKDKGGYDMIPTADYINDKGIHIFRLENGLFIPAPVNIKMRTYIGFYKRLVQEKPDVIFVHCCQFWDIRKIVKYKKNHPTVKLFIDNHADMINSAHNFLSKNILHKIIWTNGVKKIEPYTNKFFGVTPNRCKFLTDMYQIKPEKIELLVMGADDSKIDFEHKDQIRKSIRERLHIADDDFVIITGGKIDKRKNIHLLMQAVKEIAIDKIKLIVFGNLADEIVNTINPFLQIKSIKYIGWVKSEEAYNYFLASDLAVFPGTHSVLWEQSVGTGLPGVFKIWEGMTHVDIGGNCLLLKEGNLEEIKEAIIRIYNDPILYESMQKVALDKGVKEFSYSRIARRAIGEA